MITNRAFGFFFSGVFFFLSVLLFNFGGFYVPLVFILMSLLFFLLGILNSLVILPFKRLWYSFGNILASFSNPLVLGLIYFVIITPLAVVLRFFGRDELRLRRNNATTYWVTRSDIGIDPKMFDNQY